MTILRLILGDQLTPTLSSLRDTDKENDIIFMCEVWEEATYVKHHKKKIAFIFSAMRHFAQELKDAGYQVRYIKLNDAQNQGSFKAELQAIIKSESISKIIATFPGEYRVLEDMKSWQKEFNIPVEIREDDRFLCSLKNFKNWAQNRKSLTMEYFYREIRKTYSVLMDNEQPLGGQWNYDSENRKPPKKGLSIPPPCTTKTDEITQDVINLVRERFSDHFGDVEPFHFAVTRKDALAVLDHFIQKRIYNFGDYQDAMIEGEPWMYHSHISFYLNIGLLLPLECIEAAEQAYQQGKAPLNAVEGFIRQIIGWREYVRGLYWLKMPEYKKLNYFNAQRKLPDFYWTAKTDMNCLKQCIRETKENAYAHHIQRLMVLGNFALIAGINPKYVNEWFMIVYADAYEWVELPNVSGMILFADGGYLATKPYAAGGSYINKMSNYCKNCKYSVTEKNGSNACPFNYLYWDFLARNKDKLSSNHRMGMMYRTYERMSDDKKQAITQDSKLFLNSLGYY